jgi:membrane-bound serine protease (ClpP class)
MGAISAGALISFACKDLIMTPDTNIGAATPVMPTAEGLAPTGEKEVSFMRAKMRSLAERNGHNPAIAEAMVDKDIELRSYVDPNGKLQVFAVYSSPTQETVAPARKGTDDPAEIVRRAVDGLPSDLDTVKKLVKEALPESKKEEPPPPRTNEHYPESDLVLPAGKLLTLTPQEAIRFGVIPTTANNLQEVLSYYGCANAEIRRITPTWSEALFRWLTSPLIAGLLLMFGIGGIYVEMKTPGAILPGIIGVVCLMLFFGSHLIIGLAEWLDVLLVVIGIVLILVEIFALPGHGALAGAGIVCLIVGLYLSLTGFVIPRYSWDYERLKNAGVSLTVAATTLSALVYVMWKLFPHTPLYGRFVQQHVQLPDKGYVVQTAEERMAAIGRKGVAATMLRPAGRGRFGNTTYQVVSHGEYISRGTPIVIVEVDGNRYVVDKLEENA